jgi:16S rRNA (guanine(966)-N(2))-methyltransferase RsmD
MRVIAGSLRSRPLQAPPGLTTRPTSDRLRETLFNVLALRMKGAHFLDLYAGSGAVGIEALSRGAARVVWVERAAGALKVLRANLERLGITEPAEVRAEAVGTYLRKGAAGAGFDVVFLDPPYDAASEYDAVLRVIGTPASDPRSPNGRDLGHSLLRHPILNAGAVVIAEHRRKQRLAESYEALTRTRLLEQGDAALSFYAVSEPKAENHEGTV